MNKIIGRKQELKTLNDVCHSSEAEFIAIYGRRRVGKTFLVREYFQRADLFTECTGIKGGNTKKQLELFASALSTTFYNGKTIPTPASWHDAFEIYTELLESHQNKSGKMVLFLDELPWLASKRSMLMQEIDHYWNTRWSKKSNFILVVCGSAASWMLTNLINAKGGLHNRISHRILLKPFSLTETQLYLENNGIHWKKQQILDLYMVTGGIPYYLKQIKPRYSVAQNINALCFNENGILNDEFSRLLASLYDEHELHLKIIRLLATRKHGLSRKQLLSQLKIKSGGRFNKRIHELQASGFINSYLPFGKNRDVYYKVIDEYCLFYLRWIEPGKTSGHNFISNYWQTTIHTPAWNNWAGHAFESICFKHIEEIRQALELSNIACKVSSWRFIPEKNNAQNGAEIDLLFDRQDDAITLCEIKYSNKPFAIDKSYAKQLANKINVFETKTKTKKQIMLALITTQGMKPTIWTEGLVQQDIALEDWF